MTFTKRTAFAAAPGVALLIGLGRSAQADPTGLSSGTSGVELPSVTFSSLGATPGTYEWTSGTGASLRQTRRASWIDITLNFSGRKNAGKLYLQNAQYTPGQPCHATTSSGDEVNVGKYNDQKECCGPKLSNGAQFCINCDGTNYCSDGTK